MKKIDFINDKLQKLEEMYAKTKDLKLIKAFFKESLYEAIEGEEMGLIINDIQDDVLQQLSEEDKKFILSLPKIKNNTVEKDGVIYKASYFGCKYAITHSTIRMYKNKPKEAFALIYESFAKRLKEKVLDKYEVIGVVDSIFEMPLAVISPAKRSLIMWYVFLKEHPEGLIDNSSFFDADQTIPSYDEEYLEARNYTKGEEDSK